MSCSEKRWRTLFIWITVRADFEILFLFPGKFFNIWEGRCCQQLRPWFYSINGTKLNIWHGLAHIGQTINNENEWIIWNEPYNEQFCFYLSYRNNWKLQLKHIMPVRKKEKKERKENIQGRRKYYLFNVLKIPLLPHISQYLGVAAGDSLTFQVQKDV